MDDKKIRTAVKEFNARRREQDADAEKVSIRRVDEKHCTLKLEYEDEVIVFNFPRTADSIWFCTEPEWLSAELNSAILVGLMTFPQILATLCSRIDKRLMESSMGLSASSGLEDSIGLSQSGMGLEASGLYVENHDANYALAPDELAELKLQVAEAQGVLGQDKVVMVPELGSVKMVVDIYGMMDHIIAERLGFQQDENVFMSFSYEKSAIPSVSCTQRVAPGYGIKNHLKLIIDYFFSCWHNDRELLKRVGRPPQGLVQAAAPPAITSGNDNNADKEATAAKPKQSWWKSVTSVFKGDASPQALVKVTPEAVCSVMELGFDAISCTRALVDARNDVDNATMRVVNNVKKYQPSRKQMSAFESLKANGVSDAEAAAALIRTNFVVDDALDMIGGPNKAEIWNLPASTSSMSMTARSTSSKGKKKMAEEQHPFNQENFVFALLSYLEERLSHYGSYCVSCQEPHSCYNPDGGVVCSEPLCVFQLEESPMEKLISVHLCPFKDCCDLDLSTVGKEFMGMPLDEICKSYGLTSQQLLELLLHRYLPSPQIKLLLENGLRTSNCKRLESVLNPTLCARYEHAWKDLREKYAGTDIKVEGHVAYHGTNEHAVRAILDTGFLLSKLSKGSGDNGWFGCGIYFSPNIQTAMGYCRGKIMMVCAVLMGKICKLMGRCDGAQLTEGYDSHEDPSGQEWVIYHEERILPVYLIHF